MSKWSALSGQHHPSRCHQHEETVEQEAAQVSKTVQSSEEHIIIRDSCEVFVHTTDTKAAVNLQVALQLAVALVLSITIADSNDADRVAQELLQKVTVKQLSHQKTLIENSRNVKVTTTDTDVAVNIQVLLQLLVALIAKLDIL
ncbi:spore coat protein [Tumebacillus flagellatus]|uniref:spore coat protein n=1 Tax=Tumebacillus flagellatus TaxID=1157490 RepID=UPI0005705498|nr:spore coat protein [Tumebacillus flagellatus]